MHCVQVHVGCMHLKCTLSTHLVCLHFRAHQVGSGSLWPRQKVRILCTFWEMGSIFPDGCQFPLAAARQASNVWSGSLSAPCSYWTVCKTASLLSRRTGHLQWLYFPRVYSFCARVYKIIVAFAAVKF